MSITSSFYSGLSGLDTHATAMQIIGDNISNIHTTGFKSSSAHFEDVLGMSLIGVIGGNQTGAGTEIATIDANFIQGSLQTTGVGTDVAVNGEGFFVVGDPLNDEVFYTRAGHFLFDNLGYYVNTQGYRVQGYLYDGTGATMIENLSDIQINQNSMVPPKVTSLIEMVTNVDASAEIPTTAWNTADPFTSSNFTTTISIFDSLGESHSVQVFFRKTAANQWEWHALINGGDLVGGTEGVYQELGTNSLNFDTSGMLQPPQLIDFNSAQIQFVNGSTIAANDIDIDFEGTTQYGSASNIQKLNQNGYVAGTVSGIAVDEDGNLVANYTNGTRKKIARIALADFSNLNGLARKGSTLLQATSTSGDPLYNKPGVGGMGKIFASMLEESNVDLAAEFIKMIVIQRGYQANTKVITTTDEMLAQLLNIK